MYAFIIRFSRYYRLFLYFWLEQQRTVDLILHSLHSAQCAFDSTFITHPIDVRFFILIFCPLILFRRYRRLLRSIAVYLDQKCLAQQESACVQKVILSICESDRVQNAVVHKEKQKKKKRNKLVYAYLHVWIFSLPWDISIAKRCWTVPMLHYHWIATVLGYWWHHNRTRIT